VVVSDAVVVARMVVDAGVKCLVGERLRGCRLSSLATAQATHDHYGDYHRHGAASMGR
jgi:hypothetical protein